MKKPEFNGHSFIEPIKLMVKKAPGPVFFTLIGTGGLFYAPKFRGLPVFAFILGLIVLGFLCLFRILYTRPAARFADQQRRKQFRRAGVYCYALVLGLLLGFVLRLFLPGGPELGLPEAQIRGFTGILQDDPRALGNGGGMGLIRLEEAVGWVPGSVRSGPPVRTSARGTLRVFFPEGSIPRLKTFGRLSRVYLEGKLGRSATSGEIIFQAQGVHILKSAPALEQWRTGLRMALIEKLSPHDWGGLALALLLGVRDKDVNLAEAYRRAGCSHVLALSGMHLALISGLLAFLLKKPLGSRFAALLGGLALILYTFLVGPQPSLVRALIIYGLGVLCLWGNFPRNPLSLLGIAFLLQLVIDPTSGKTPSFLLSYTGLGGLLLFQEPIENILRGRLPKLALKPLAASLGAFLGTIGISAYFFGTVYPIGILAGLIIIPLTSLFMIALILVLPLSAIPGVSGPIGNLLSAFYAILSKLVAGFGQVPGIPIANPVPLWVITAVLALLLFGFGNWYGARRSSIAPFTTA